MKNKRNIIILTAATLILSLCGFFLSRLESTQIPVLSSSAETSQSYVFSMPRALRLLDYCSAAAYPKSLEALVCEDGFESFVFEERAQKTPLGNGIAMGTAHKKEPSKGTSVTVVFRGTKDSEWYSNFSVGEGEVHAGFFDAAEFAKERIDSYLFERGIDKGSVKLTLTGHSRGGAVANILAKLFLDEGLFGSVEAYTFASPNTTTESCASLPCYQSIFNITNPEDIICRLPPKSWGYTKYGTNISLPFDISGKDKELYKKMQESFFSKCKFPHKGYKNGSRDIDLLEESFCSLCPDVSDYYSKDIKTPAASLTLSEYMQSVCGVLSGKSPLSSGLLILSCLENCELSSLTSLLLEGISLEDLSSSSVTRGALYCSHTYEVYEAWLEVLSKEYS